ncbi:hypothetical protein Vretimale_18198 [Volvox reticuliferus]|uniref:Uncharacterized protein n=1 Tax=Volvox reticuliferus TaxID=1737510 RepID=A0A8J4D0S0_9CHLO|nr:hypothetical protein Vretifemale_17971 [Volvox reticuliferus]GIM15428.1 hypothetical protein Vretimale_18198 [Volvox reticuliferus]
MLLSGGVVDSQVASSVIAGECRAILARQRGVAEDIYDKLAASQAQLSHELNRLRNALVDLPLPEPLALPADYINILTRIQRKVAELSRRLSVVEARMSRIKARLQAAK